ncbi:MOSC domain-containing protein [Heliophilum fasciatum]|uniref:Molybdenum cofactor synthesis domain-containing protein n=1 Tax=Heliophilum fasciatum TaxID=35700 RepID=A0A4R2RJI4_9FIRM|nr:MOSC domain-containing protein [Heliophilum fasciatum]MCW2278619.1 molybdenum cofactor synthesis domain-containing protein [Heliophilum fasciatum]TCP62679.1 molybdenum cofactor synthesis domain-containing protein [Heliophilum fasciatum]
MNEKQRSVGHLVAVCSSEQKGTRKINTGRGILRPDFGLEGDAHGGPWHRQVSLLALESIEKMRAQGLSVHPGDFAENLTTVGLDLVSLPVGTRLKIGGTAIGEVTQIGKECHSRCAIYEQAGDCVMPREGIFMRVIAGGAVQVGDPVIVLPPESRASVARTGQDRPWRVGIVTASDKGSRGERVDGSGAVIREQLTALGAEVVGYQVVSDDRAELAAAMRMMADELHVDLLLTTGGTGFAPRDVTPEATGDVIDRLVPGLAEAMRAESAKVTNRAMLTRGIAGIRRRTLIVNLPGSPKAVRECLAVILPVLSHGLEVLGGEAGDCARP